MHLKEICVAGDETGWSKAACLQQSCVCGAVWVLELSKVQRLGCPDLEMFENITHNMQSHRNRLLYMLKESCGLGHKKLSDVIMAAKWALLHRSEQGDWETRQAAQSSYQNDHSGGSLAGGEARCMDKS